MKEKKGFTLVELLVVLAIIGILTSLVAPRISKAIERSKEEKCRTNLKQLHTAVISYANDHSGYLPLASSYEYYDSVNQRYVGKKGWISWLPSDDNSKTLAEMWQGAKGQTSQASKLDHIFGSNPRAYAAIENGTIFSYMGESFQHYACPKQKGAIFTYAMNVFFCSEENRHWENRKLSRIGTSENIKLGDDKKYYTPEAAKLLLFTETLAPSGNDKDKIRKGTPPREKKTSMTSDAGDCYIAINGPDDKNSNDNPPLLHAGKTAMAIFLDGHIENIENTLIAGGDKVESSLWYYSRGISPSYK